MKRKMLFSNRMYYEIISSCNLSCKHCSDLLSGQVEMLEVDEILNFISKLWVIFDYLFRNSYMSV